MGRPKRKSTSPFANNSNRDTNHGPSKTKRKTATPETQPQDQVHQDTPTNHSTSSQPSSSQPQQDLTVVYWRDPPSQVNDPRPAEAISPSLQAASTGASGINEQVNFPTQNTKQIPSIHSALGSHVSQSNKNKIINGEYLDLSQLLENTVKNERQENQIVMVDGVLTAKERSKRSITTIEVWTDAFIVYISIYSAVHAAKLQGLLKYMHDIRLGASRIRGLGWKDYDEQFRLKMSSNPTKSWEEIDQELWLLYMVSTSSELKNNPHGFTKTSVNKCYNYNYKGMCDRTPCTYKHICFKCSGNHPFFACTVGVAPNPINHPFRPGTPNRFQNPGFQNQFRPRLPAQSARSHSQAGPKYMGPRQFSY